MCIEPFKKELAWAVDKWLSVISTIKWLKNTKELKVTKEQSHFKFKTLLYMLLYGP